MTPVHNLIVVSSWQQAAALYGGVFLSAVLFVGIVISLTCLSQK